MQLTDEQWLIFFGLLEDKPMASADFADKSAAIKKLLPLLERDFLS